MAGPGRYWDRAWNPITGCTPCSPACLHCWAAGMVRRFPHLHGWRNVRDCTDEYESVPLPFGDIVEHAFRIDDPVRRRKPTVYAVCWLGDLWHEDVPNDTIRRVLRAAALAPQHTYLFLTKRYRALVQTAAALTAPAAAAPGSIWIGASAWDSQSISAATAALEDIRRTVHGVRTWLSLEPLLGPLDSIKAGDLGRGLDQVIAGPETGPGARPCRPSALQLVELACAMDGVPCWRKDRGAGRLAWRDDTMPGPMEREA